jgi:hypothetical protein
VVKRAQNLSIAGQMRGTREMDRLRSIDEFLAHIVISVAFPVRLAYLADDHLR